MEEVLKGPWGLRPHCSWITSLCALTTRLVRAQSPSPRTTCHHVRRFPLARRRPPLPILTPRSSTVAHPRPDPSQDIHSPHCSLIAHVRAESCPAPLLERSTICASYDNRSSARRKASGCACSHLFGFFDDGKPRLRCRHVNPTTWKRSGRQEDVGRRRGK
ncbi:hypothetical protein FA95DRAFT_1340358 [Auriscalpium vulgare]|uniref:Uncharacterized protein n=1 Tax=Auriscalpium vulgare TaxID=40419 RepID=A0ACB8RS32_9AGAM|nr:hypothetical protein FA95DRAFT_1340358 [Auriscalpium vulgare]